jgi:hypothetical protein
MEIPLISIIISSVALLVSGLTAWLTFFRKGKLLMTQPTVIYFGPDQSTQTKIYLRTLLYCTAKRGQVIESLYVSLQRNETKQNFNIWVYGEGDLKRGSGLFVPQEGLEFEHHFLLPKDGADFSFIAGTYILRVFAKIVGEQSSRELLSINLQITDSLANQLNNQNAGLYFDWGPDSQSYHPHIQIIPENNLEEILEGILTEKKALPKKSAK